MGMDFLTTTYVLENQIGYEANGLMSGIVGNQILFISVKIITSMVIILMMKKCLSQNKIISHIGMRIIIFLLLFVVANNLMIINASALSFSPFNGGTIPGTINTGNGYFDNDASFFNYSGDRNVYVVSELNNTYIFEPLGRSAGTSGTSTLIHSSLNTIYGSVVHEGYLYFVDGTTLKKKKTRNDGSMCESTDTGNGGCIQVIATAVNPTLRTYRGTLYFTTETHTLNYLDENDNQVTAFDPPGTSTGVSSFTVYISGGTLHMVNTQFAATITMSDCTASACTTLATVTGGSIPTADTYFTLSNNIFGHSVPQTGTAVQKIFLLSNGTGTTVSYIATDIVGRINRAYVGSRSTVGLANLVNTYYTFNSVEPGTDSLPGAPNQLTYDTKTIESLDSTYYNKSDIFLQYNVVVNSANLDNILLDIGDYRWMISMTDPNGVSQDIVQSPACRYDSFLDFTCQVYSSMGIPAPQNGWLAGTWTAKLYEINIIDPNRALIATSSSFTVLNTSLENQSIIPPPYIPPTSGTAPQAITLIDGFVSWLGMGVNSVSKLLFAMIIIAMAATVGLMKGNGNIAMVFAFVPYAFFTFIDYIPKWIFIISIILIAIVSRAFR